MKEKLRHYIMGVFLGILIAFGIITQLNCISAPDTEDYTFKDCYDTAYCRYLNARSDTNKVDCSKDADYCNKIRCMTNCNKKEIRGPLTWGTCWDKLR